jgi:hypothetical protein
MVKKSNYIKRIIEAPQGQAMDNDRAVTMTMMMTKRQARCVRKGQGHRDRLAT